MRQKKSKLPWIEELLSAIYGIPVGTFQQPYSLNLLLTCMMNSVLSIIDKSAERSQVFVKD